MVDHIGAITPSQYHKGEEKPIKAINWNEIEDSLDLDLWNRFTANFWLPEKVPVSNDLQSWRALNNDDQTAVMRVFAGLTLLDTIQGTVGAVQMIPHARTQHEEAVYTNIAFMESVHAKSYSNIFMTLASTERINEAMRWSEDNQYLQNKAKIILDYYGGDDEYKLRIASVMLESFLFYSGFYLPLHHAAHGRLTNTADIIKLIIRDESLHGFYIGSKYQTASKELPDEVRDSYQDFTIDLLLKLYENEVKYTETIYDSIGLTEDVKAFLRYNANKALNNLGYDAIFDVEDTRASSAVIGYLNPTGDESHDFFSGSGSSYVVGTVEELDDDDFDF